MGDSRGDGRRREPDIAPSSSLTPLLHTYCMFTSRHFIYTLNVRTYRMLYGLALKTVVGIA